MEFTNAELGVTFKISEPVKVRKVMAYDAEIETRFGLYDRLWRGVCAIAENWECELLPELTPDHLDLLSLPENQAQYEIIKWASLAVFSYIHDLKQIPKKG